MTIDASNNRLRKPEALLFQSGAFDWDALTAEYVWVRRLQGVPQNPAFHAEGDVWIHTSMVARALLQLTEWQALPPHEQGLLYAAALLHDVAKPVCTVFDDGGVASSPNHARRGEGMAREILEDSGVSSYADREAVAKLVRYHGLPLWFLEKPDMARSLVRASMDIRLDWIALLAEADVRGRICADQANLLEMIELFREASRELDCYETPRKFASDHARFMYFRHAEYDLNYSAYDDRTFGATILCGLPGSGKDTWIARFGEDLPVMSLDDIRHQLGVPAGENQRPVVEIAKQRAQGFLIEKQPFIWNATNLSRLLRDPLIEQFASYGARVRVVVCHAPLERALRQNARRAEGAVVPAEVICGMLRRFDPPSLADCHELVIHEG